jgi:tripartite-type tricarboxylate transporter receptor subunit TctC
MLMNALNKLFLALALVVGAATIAAAFPDKSVSYVIPFGPGGESDVSARLQQPVFQKKYGQELVITYRRAAAAPSAGRSSTPCPATDTPSWA